ncbi:MAG: hypothetical protein HOK84_17510 [Bacteroidetes bacterium]|nr:hypothetical protein [Bacteroidota bacterium]
MKKFQRYLYVLIIVIAATQLISCTKKSQTNLLVRQFDKSLFNSDNDSLSESIRHWKALYPHFFPVFTDYVIGIGLPDDPGFEDYLIQFKKDPVILNVFKLTQNKYPDFEQTGKQIAQGVRNYQKMIDASEDIIITSFISGFNQSFLSLEKELAIGIDNYLGVDCQYYPQLGLPEYIYNKMSPEYLPGDAVRAWIMSDMAESSEQETLLDKIISEGKILYTAELAMKKYPEHLLFRYSKDELNWCENNEKSMWEYIVGKELLFSSDHMLIQRLTQDAPFTREFGNDSPGRCGNWLGYQIVKRYMGKSKCTITDLLHSVEASKILAESGYHPR